MIQFAVMLCFKGEVTGGVAAVDFEFRDLGKLEEKKAFPAGDKDFNVAAFMAVDQPAVSVRRLKAGVTRTGVNRFPGAIIIAYL